MDPGWIKTDYEYYSGEVVRIYDTVYAAMMNDPQRKFVFAEIVNFKR